MTSFSSSASFHASAPYETDRSPIDMNLQNQFEALLLDRGMSIVTQPTVSQEACEQSADDLTAAAFGLNVEKLHQKWHSTRGLLQALAEEETRWITDRKKLDEVYVAFKGTAYDLGYRVNKILSETGEPEKNTDVITAVLKDVLLVVTEATNRIISKLQSIEDRRLRPARAREQALRVLQLAMDTCVSDQNSGSVKHMCCICFNNAVDMFLIPCGHTFCHECAQKGATLTCPNCRKCVTSVSKLYFSNSD